jgi:hypothetical protein
MRVRIPNLRTRLEDGPLNIPDRTEVAGCQREAATMDQIVRDARVFCSNNVSLGTTDVYASTSARAVDALPAAGGRGRENSRDRNSARSGDNSTSALYIR